MGCCEMQHPIRLVIGFFTKAGKRQTNQQKKKGA